jgi:hypothetical protein
MGKFKDLVDKEMSYITEVAPAESQVGAQVGQPTIPVQQGTSKPPTGPSNTQLDPKIAVEQLIKTLGSNFKAFHDAYIMNPEVMKLMPKSQVQATTNPTGQPVQPIKA